MYIEKIIYIFEEEWERHQAEKKTIRKENNCYKEVEILMFQESIIKCKTFFMYKAMNEITKQFYTTIT